MRKIISLDEFNSLKNVSTSSNRDSITDIENANKLKLEVSKFMPCHIMVEVGNVETNEPFYVQSYLIIDNTNVRIFFNHYNNKKQYTFYSMLKFENLTRYDIERITKQFEVPQKVGVLSTKKIQSWVDYLTAIDNIAIADNDKNKNEIETFLKSIEGQNVRWFNNNKSGEIIKNGLIFKFTIEETYVSKKIEVYYKPENTLENFLKLSDNQYKG